jgi:hypothetical protein
MIAAFLWLAQEEVPMTMEEMFKAMTIDYRHLVTFGSVLLVSLGGFIWAAFFRKPRRRRHHHSHRHSPGPMPETRPESRKIGWWLFSKRRRHRRRQRSRNPTLAEAGGPPPVRTPAPPPTPG